MRRKTDRELIGYLDRCAGAQNPGGGGGMVAKENLNTSGREELNEEDISVTR